MLILFRWSEYELAQESFSDWLREEVSKLKREIEPQITLLVMEQQYPQYQVKKYKLFIYICFTFLWFLDKRWPNARNGRHFHKWFKSYWIIWYSFNMFKNHNIFHYSNWYTTKIKLIVKCYQYFVKIIWIFPIINSEGINKKHLKKKKIEKNWKKKWSIKNK